MPQRSSIERLPEEVRDVIEREFKSGRLTLDELVELVRSEFGEDKTPSRSALGRARKNFDEIAKEHRQAMSIARVWTEEIGQEPDGDIGRACVEVLRTLAFRGVQEAYEEGLDPKALSTLGLAMQRIEAAGQLGFKTRLAIREQALKEAADRVEDAAKAQGMGAEQAQFWRQKVLAGI